MEQATEVVAAELEEAVVEEAEVRNEELEKLEALPEEVLLGAVDSEALPEEGSVVHLQAALTEVEVVAAALDETGFVETVDHTILVAAHPASAVLA